MNHLFAMHDAGAKYQDFLGGIRLQVPFNTLSAAINAEKQRLMIDRRKLCFDVLH